MRLVQLTRGTERSVALVDEPNLLLLDKVKSVFEIASLAIKRKTALSQLVKSLASGEQPEPAGEGVPPSPISYNSNGEVRFGKMPKPAGETPTLPEILPPTRGSGEIKTTWQWPSWCAVASAKETAPRLLRVCFVGAAEPLQEIL